MPNRDEFVNAVTEFLAAHKSLAGIDLPAAWTPGRQSSEITAKIPIEIDGVQHGHKVVLVYVPARQGYAINLVFADQCVSRLDYDSHGPHLNPFGFSANQPPSWVGPRHFHRWEPNRRFVESGSLPIDLKVAEELSINARNFDDVLRHFCDACSIDLLHDHRIELPRMLL
jgi:hypothetical protein